MHFLTIIANKTKIARFNKSKETVKIYTLATLNQGILQKDIDTNYILKKYLFY